MEDRIWTKSIIPQAEMKCFLNKRFGCLVPKWEGGYHKECNAIMTLSDIKVIRVRTDEGVVGAMEVLVCPDCRRMSQVPCL